MSPSLRTCLRPGSQVSDGSYLHLHKHLCIGSLCSSEAEMASTASNGMPAGSTAAGPSKTPPRLHSEMSQQELEIARHLIEHSQSIPSHQMSEAHANKDSQQPLYPSNGEYHAPVSNHQRHDLNDSMPGFGQSYPSPQNATYLDRQSPNATVPAVNGQMCRYVWAS